MSQTSAEPVGNASNQPKRRIGGGLLPVPFPRRSVIVDVRRLKYMRYFTRQLIDAMQPGPGEPETDRAIATWQRNVDEYRAALHELKPRLLTGFAWLADTTLHDGVITGIDTAGSDEIVLTVDAANNPWGQTGVVNLEFRGIRSANGLEECVGDVWLYEELHEANDAIEVCVMLEAGEFCIVATSLFVTCEH